MGTKGLHLVNIGVQTGRSMAERLAELANPTPEDVDIEDIVDGVKIGGRGDDEEDDDFYGGLVTEVCDENGFHMCVI